MRNYIKPVYLLILSIALLRCQQGVISTDLSCGYRYVDRGSTYRELFPNDTLRPKIEPNVIQYEYNSAFILVLQKPDYEKIKNFLSFSIRLRTPELSKNGSEELAVSGRMAEEKIESDSSYKKLLSNMYNLWIITKDKTYGPLSLSEYMKLRKELGVPAGLQLNI